MSFVLLGILNSQAAGAGGADFELIAEATPSSGNSVTFANIPQDYKHLLVVGATEVNAGAPEYGKIRWNGDSSSEYRHVLAGSLGNGDALRRNTALGSGEIRASGPNFQDYYEGWIADYTNTSKNQTIYGKFGAETSSGVGATVILTTGATTSLELFAAGNNTYNTDSYWAVYGVRG